MNSRRLKPSVSDFTCCLPHERCAHIIRAHAPGSADTSNRVSGRVGRSRAAVGSCRRTWLTANKKCGMPETRRPACPVEDDAGDAAGTDEAALKVAGRIGEESRLGA